MIMRVSRLAWVGFVQLLRTRVYLNLLVAGVAVVAAALAFDEVSSGEGGRVLIDVGLAFVSLVVAVLAGTFAITTITREIESKQVQLLATRPMARAEIVLGRFLTIATLVVLSNLLLGGLLSVLLAILGAKQPGIAVIAALFCSFEGFVVAAVAIFFGVGSSSTMSAVFTTTIFILGRLTGELAVLVERERFGPLTPIMKVAYQALPHLSDLDLTLWWHQTTPDVMGAVRAAVAAGIYAAAFLALAIWRFARRDLL